MAKASTRSGHSVSNLEADLDAALAQINQDVIQMDEIRYPQRTGAKREQYKDIDKDKLTIVMNDDQNMDEIVICGIKFQKSVVKNRADFTIQRELGAGAFGAVYQGHLDMGPLAR